MALKDTQAPLSAASQAYLSVTVDDTVHGAMTFLLGDVEFVSTNVYGGALVSACVVDWGTMVKYLPNAGGARENQFTIRLAADAYIYATDVASKRFRVYEALHALDFRNLAVSIYQWNAESSTQEVVWKGYWSGVT